MAQHQRGGFQVEYAKSGRSSCKGCGGSIKQAEMRIGKEVKSDHHDGYDLSWYHLKCAPYCKSIKDIKDWELLRWADQNKIRKDFTKEAITNTEEDKVLEAENKRLWELKDELEEEVPAKILKAILEANNMSVDKVTPSRLIHKVADGMI